jgi:hypothetical protein
VFKHHVKLRQRADIEGNCNPSLYLVPFSGSAIAYDRSTFGQSEDVLGFRRFMVDGSESGGGRTDTAAGRKAIFPACSPIAWAPKQEENEVSVHSFQPEEGDYEAGGADVRIHSKG